MQTAGCTFFSKHLDKQYYFIEPSLVSLGEGRIPCEAKAKKSDKPDEAVAREPAISTNLEASDTLVLIYSDCVKKMLRARMNLARVARLSSGTFAVLTAAAAAALGAVSTAPLTAITALAAASAVTPEVMKIFGADDRARAYHDGVRLIEGAEGQYLRALAALPPGPVVIPKYLTPGGADLYLQVVTSLKIVEDLLVSQLPSVEDIQIAQGRIRASATAQVQVSVVQEISKELVRTTDTDAASRQVAYKVTVTNVSAAPIRSATLNIHVRGAKSMKNAAGAVTSNGWQPGTPTNTTCTVEGDKDLRCTIVSLAPDGVVTVPITATVQDATAAERLYVTPQVWEEPTKLHLSGPLGPRVVNVEKAPIPAPTQ